MEKADRKGKKSAVTAFPKLAGREADSAGSLTPPTKGHGMGKLRPEVTNLARVSCCLWMRL